MSGENKLQAILERFPPLPEGMLLAGVSGGADSFALLEILYRRREREGYPFHVIHVNHGLRGASSEADEAFVREACLARSVPLTVCRIDLSGRTDENAAREARYAGFLETYRQIHAEALVLAHHRDDQAETFLLHLLRGAGMDGLSGIRPDLIQKGMRVLRPMLGFSRAEIREALKMEGLSWREDESNLSDAYARNLVRNRLLPAMEARFPGASEHIAAAAEMIREETEALNTQAERFLSRYGGKDYLELKPLLSQEPAMQRRILRSWWARSFSEGCPEKALSRRQTEALCAILDETNGKVNLPGNCCCSRGRKALHLIPEKRKPAPEPVAFMGKSADWGPFRLEVLASGDKPGDGKRTQTIPLSLLKDTVIRSRRPGDRISPFGSGYTRKLQDYLTDRGVDEPWRDQVPLLCRENEVLLAGGVGAGNIPRMGIGENEVCLKWRGEMPWLEKQEDI